MIINNFQDCLNNFNKSNKEIIILEHLINKIKNIIKLNIFSLKEMKIHYK